jgi:hypothetical protein
MPPQPAPQQQDQWAELDADDPMQQRVAQLEQRLEQERQERAAAEVARQNEFLEAGWREGVAEFSEQYKGKLDQTDMDLLRLEVQRSGLLPALYSRTRDPRAATKEAFETVVWSKDEYRQKLLHADESARAAADAEERERARRAAALAGSGGVPEPARAPVYGAPPTNLAEARAQAAAVLQQASSFEAGNGSVA